MGFADPDRPCPVAPENHCSQSGEFCGALKGRLVLNGCSLSHWLGPATFSEQV